MSKHRAAGRYSNFYGLSQGVDVVAVEFWMPARFHEDTLSIYEIRVKQFRDARCYIALPPPPAAAFGVEVTATPALHRVACRCIAVGKSAVGAFARNC